MTVNDGSALRSVMSATKDDATIQSVSSNTSGLFMPGTLSRDLECSLESFGSGTDSCQVTVNTGDMLDIELDTRSWGPRSWSPSPNQMAPPLNMDAIQQFQ